MSYSQRKGPGVNGLEYFMKNEQQEEAKDLYFNSNLSKTEIADRVGVSRKTIVYWSQQGNWEQVRQSARNMPSLVAEKCYYLIDHSLNSLLAESNARYAMMPLTLKDAQTIHLLAATIKKLKNRSTVNESMEMFNFFLGGLTRRDPELAAQVAPQIEEYITIRKNCETNDFLMEEFRHDATLPHNDKEFQEGLADKTDSEELYREFEELLKTRDEKKAAPKLNDAT